MCAHVQAHAVPQFTRGSREEEGKEILLDMKDKSENEKDTERESNTQEM